MDRGTLLIVEDEDDVLEVLANYLRSLGYTVHGAESRAGTERLLAELDTIDAAIVDWSLPDGCGRDVITAIRARHPQCHFVVTTGHGAGVVNDTRDIGLPANIVRKPYTMRTLYQRVAVLLEPPPIDGQATESDRRVIR